MATRRTRRDFLITSAAAGSLALVAPEELLATRSGTVFIRRNVKFLGPTHPDIVSLKAGIQAMKNLPASNPLNWNRWANIHGHPTGLSGPLYNTCQHGHWWFFPWHRMYVLMFERIIRQLSGNPDFSLPYWDYTAGTVAGSLYNAGALPRLFWSPQNNTNPLYNPVRGGGATAGYNAGASIPPAALSTSVAMATTSYIGSTRFGGQQVASPTHFASPHGRLEASPHDSVHSSIGGDMGDPGRAARDPIFWLHHCNIDRLWNVWLRQTGRANPVGNAAWCRQQFRFFNTAGVQVTMRVRDVLRAQAQLSYRYEEEPLPQAAPVCTNAEEGLETVEPPPLESRTLVKHQQTITLGASPTRVNLPMADQQESVRGVADDTRRNLVLRLEGVRIDRHPGVVYEVYVGLPAGQPAVHTSPYFVGVLSTFGVGRHDGHADPDGAVIAFPIDRAAAAALTANPDTVPITFVPRGRIVGGRAEALDLQGRVTFTRFRVHAE